jgi:hypothetical protein
MERSVISQPSGTTKPADVRSDEHSAEDRTKIVLDIESLSLPPFFALSPGWKRLAVRMRALIGRASTSR